MSQTSVFQDQVIAKSKPVVQIDGAYGLISTDAFNVTSPGGTATTVNGLFSCAIDNTIGAFAVIRSHKQLRQQAGQGVRARFTTIFDTPVAQSVQWGGLFNVLDAYFIGYSGTTFGCLHRIAGAVEIQRLTISAGTGGAETVTVTLNGVAFPVVVGGATTTAQLATALAAATGYTGWVSPVSPRANDSQVTFIQNIPGTAAGAFTLTSTGTAAGTFARVAAGAPNDESTGFVSANDWNDVGEEIDPAALNEWQIEFGIGVAPTILSWLNPDGEWVEIYRYQFVNRQTFKPDRIGSFRAGWVCASLGSTTPLEVKGGSASAFLDGDEGPVRDPFATKVRAFTASTTETVALAIRSRGDFQATVNLREVFPNFLSAGTETANRVILARLVASPTVSVGTITWNYIAETRSCVEYATPTGVQITGGEEVFAFQFATGAASSGGIRQYNIRIDPGETLMLALQTASNTAVCNASIGWEEY